MNTSYLNRIHHVVDYVHANLDRNLSLVELAREAAISPFHFHRLFKAIMGESPHHFVNRLRLERACTLLRFQRQLTITDIAHRSGFPSSAAFARSFKALYGMNARNYRTETLQTDPEHKRKIWKEKRSLERYSGLKGEENQSSCRFQVEIRNCPSTVLLI